MSAPDPTPPPPTLRPSWSQRLGPLVRHGPWIAVLLLAAWIVWPVPTGAMPMSADHTVHLTRIWMWADALAGGTVRDWSPVWFFGTPVGEFYPVLGDALVIGVRVLSLGGLSWHSAYAFGFFLVFAAQGLAMLRAGRAIGLGPWPGLVAAALILTDVGAYREGGWYYTVLYGVWPQALSTALTWLGFAELCRAVASDDEGQSRRHVGLGALALGGGLLAHPMAMLTMAVSGPLLVATLGSWRRQTLARAAAIGVIGVALGTALAAWWLLPLLQHRGWMASYGWLWQPLSRMATKAQAGEWAQHMPSAVGMTISFGIAVVALAGHRAARFFAATGLVLWLLASRDAFWSLRLDHLSAGFANVQFQRFIIAAKPGLFLAAGAGVTMLGAAGVALWREAPSWLPRPAARGFAIGLGAAALSLVSWMIDGQRTVMAEHEVGTVQVERLPSDPERDAATRELAEFMRERWDARDEDFRVTFHASRNAHWYMDFPVLAEVPVFKQGFTPGDNFVHKPESGKSSVLDAARVRYSVHDRARGGRGTEVARFGALRVLERPRWDSRGLAWLQGPGTLTLESGDLGTGEIRGRIEGGDESTRLVFAVAGHPRWTLEVDGTQHEWYEVPVTRPQPPATQAQRRGGELRGGKAHGDDGSEPTLLAADVAQGEFVLRYRARTGRDVVAGLLSWLALAACVLLLLPARRVPRFARAYAGVQRRVSILGHPIVVVGLALAVTVACVVKWRAGTASESTTAVGWLEAGAGKAKGRLGPAPFKTDMLLQPAVVVRPRARGESVALFPGVALGAFLEGWTAIEDDDAKLGRKGQHRLTIEARLPGGDWSRLLEIKQMPHRPGRSPLRINAGPFADQTVDLKVTVESEGKRAPQLGFDLQLGAPSG